MSVNGFNPLAQQINQTLINPAIKKQPGTPAGETDLSMTLQGSIFSINEDSSKIGQNTPTNNSNEAPEIPMEDFLANYNLSFLDPNNIATVTTYSMPYQVVQLLENKTVPTVDITYTPEDGSCVTEHYTQNDPPQLLAKTTQSGDVITSVVYNQDGLATKTSTIEAGVTTTQVFDSAGQKVIKEIVTEQGSTTTTEFDENGNSLGSKQVKGAETYEYSPGGTLVKKTLDKGQGLIYETTYSQNAEGQTVETTKDPIGGVAVTTKNTNGKSLEQTVTTDDGKSYSVKYDGNGNTKIAVQNGETMATIAKKFDCSVEDLKSLNKTYGSGEQAYFQAGQEIVVPSEIAANDERLVTRDSKEVAESKYRASQQEIETNSEEIQDVPEILDSKNIEKTQVANAEGKKIANELYKDMDGVGTSRDLGSHLDMINSDNVVETLNAYKNRAKEGLVTAIAGEVMAIEYSNGNPYETISSSLTERARNSGVAESVISRFEAEYNGARIGIMDSEKMQKAVDILSGEIAAKEINAGEIADEKAMQIVTNTWESSVSIADENFEQARELDTNIGKATDTILGFFGCTTIDDMAEKLDLSKTQVAELTKASETNDIEAFKSVYKDIFGKNFDSKVVASYDQATTDYITAKQYKALGDNMQSLITEYEQALFREDSNYQAPKGVPFATSISSEQVAQEIQNKLQKQLGINAQQYNELLEYNGGDVKILLSNLKDSYTDLQNEVSGGQTLAQMSQNINNMRTNIFNGEDIIAEVDKFNKNQIITDVAGNIVADIAVGAALSLIPGGAALASVKMTTTAGRLANLAVKAPKTVKLCNNIVKTYESSKALQTVGKTSQKFAKAIANDMKTEHILNFINDQDTDSVKLFENSATNTGIKLGVNYLAKSLGINQKYIIDALSATMVETVRNGTELSTDNVFNICSKTFASKLGLNPIQQKAFVRAMKTGYNGILENA